MPELSPCTVSFKTSLPSGDAALPGRGRRGPEPDRGEPPLPAGPPLEPAAGEPGLRQDLQGRTEAAGLHTQVSEHMYSLYWISPKAPAPGWAVDSYKMVIVNKRESRFLDIKYS